MSTRPALIAPRPTYPRPQPMPNPSQTNPRMACPGPPQRVQMPQMMNMTMRTPYSAGLPPRSHQITTAPSSAPLPASSHFYNNNGNHDHNLHFVTTHSDQLPVDQEFVNASKFDRKSVNAQAKRCRFALKDSVASGGSDPIITNSRPVFKLAPVPVKGERRSRSPGPKQPGYQTSDNSGGSQAQIQHTRMNGGPFNQYSNQGDLNYSNSYQDKSSMHHQQPFQRDFLQFKPPLMMEKAEEIIASAMDEEHQGKVGLVRIHSGSPRKLQGGTLYLQRHANLNIKGPDGVCEDGYNWTEILHQEALSTSKGYTLDYRHFYITSSDGTKTSSKFRREAYTIGDITLIALIGDEKEAERDLTDGVSQKKSGFSSNSLPRSHRFDKRQSTSVSPMGRTDLRGSTLVLADRPRSLDRAQINKMRAIREQERRLMSSGQRSGSSLMVNNMIGPTSSPLPAPVMLLMESHNELVTVAKEVASGKLVKNLTLFPSMQITLVHPEMTREFENACQVLHNEPGLADVESGAGIRLFYDITFSMGKLYATVLTYTNACYEGNPIFPLAINLHESKFKSCHQLFWARVVGDIPALQKHRFPLFIDDAEPAVHLAVRMQAPNLVQLEGWTHRFRDIDETLKAKGYGEEAISYFKACVCYLLSAKSKQGMHDRFRKEFECIWPRDFVQYYRGKLLPRSGRLGQWAMSKMNINEIHFFSPHTNPQESFHRTCRHFVGWECLNLSQLIRACDLLFLFFVSECRGGEGRSVCIKDIYRPYFFDNSRVSWHQQVPHPSNICDYIRDRYPDRHRGDSHFGRPTSGASGPLLAYGSTRQHFAAATTGDSFDDVLQIESALERMLTDDSYSTADLDMAFNCLQDEFGGDSSSGASDRFFATHYMPHATIRTLAGFHQHAQVPSPAPNGRVPSPAPPDIPQVSYQPPPPQLVSSEPAQNAGILKSTHSSLSTIPEVPSESRHAPNRILRLHQPSHVPPPAPTTKYESLGGYPPDLLAHSNFQEHSFDSSIVTEGHYDASFESEVPPVNESVRNESATSKPDMTPTTNQGPTSSTQTHISQSLVTSGTTTQSSSRPRPTAEQRSWIGGWPGSSGSGSMTGGNALGNNSGLMLWKKVQHYVVVGGAFVNAASTSGHEANPTMVPQQPQPQHREPLKSSQT